VRFRLARRDPVFDLADLLRGQRAFAPAIGAALLDQDDPLPLAFPQQSPSYRRILEMA
jgi:hypothetical protein